MGIVTVHGLGLEGAYHSECKGHLIAEKTLNLYDNNTTRPFYQLFRAESATHHYALTPAIKPSKDSQITKIRSQT
ncbi:hypothetical protein YA0745_24050 [Pseudomonas synxantha]|uniref:Uncharacterized protein n=1 Tax=Pseudomonas synxantha TaxID=47883 RepID=A0ABS0UFU2_9PSED|nr:hypothetical protein [Pseudomonas synxantha]MBI6563192.1 hypothetical protein [Pseudomonas synxantha]MBI6581996.1 hypothetical protein [Pseudomonas synxantha]MBI6646001.1 hypothetical protein [Pseudomonas synxantha]